MNTIESIYNLFLKSNGVSTDTRKVEKGQLFFALSGPNFNGNKFARQALNKGAVAAIIDDQAFQTERTILVESSLKALQELATYHRRSFDIPVIGLTGSNGKTTTKELIAAVLSKKYKVLYTEGNLNNHIGVPLTLLRLNKEHEIAIVEMGANHQGEIGELCTIAEPNYGMITNIGKAHLEGFGGPEGVRKGKTEMYRFLLKQKGQVFFNHNESSLLPSYFESDSLIEFGKENLKVIKTSSNEEGKLVALLEVYGKSIEIQTQLFGQYNINNVLSAVAIGLQFKVSMDNIKEGIEEYNPSNNRSEIRITEKGNRLILDAYNANPTSMKHAIEQLAKAGGNKFFVLGAMKELGKQTVEEHETIVQLTSALKLDGVFVGKEFDMAKKYGFMQFENTEALENELDNFVETTILIKGSRSMQLEKLKNKF